MSGKGQTRNNISRKYLSDPRRFAQVCNNTLFGGQPVITVEGLRELDPHETKVMGLLPVFTIVVYYGEKAWDGPRTLHELLDLPESLEPHKDRLMDYHLNLVEINRMENLEQYEGDLKAFFGFMKYRSDKNQLKRFVADHQQEFVHLPYETVQAISIMGDMKELREYLQPEDNVPARGRGTVNMNQAWEDLKEEWRQEGIQKGIQEGIQEGIQKGIQEGIQEGRLQGRRDSWKELISKKLQKGKSVEKIADELEESEDAIRALIAEMDIEACY